MQRVGWMMVLGVAIIQALAGGAMLLGDVRTSFEQDTGVAWATLESAYPTVTEQFALASRSSLMGAFVVGAYSVAVCAFGLRMGLRWAWIALWLMPVSMLPGIIGLLNTDNQQMFGYFGLGLVAVTVLGLLFALPTVLSSDAAQRR